MNNNATQFVILEEQYRSVIESDIKQLLSGSDAFNARDVQDSPRAMGDVVQNVLSEGMQNCLPTGLIKNYKGKHGRKAFADISFDDINNNHYAIDVKTHNKNTVFNMPNLTSIKNIAIHYKEHKKEVFVIILVEYERENDSITFDSVRMFPIECIKWKCLSLALLGWGQIQIKNSNNVEVDYSQSRKAWIDELQLNIEKFYQKEIKKLKQRNKFFKDLFKQ